jgi:hypothetical protein
MTIEARRADHARAIEIRDTGCEGHTIVVSERDWYDFLAVIRAGRYDPYIVSGGRVFVAIGVGPLNCIEADIDSWNVFVAAVKATLFDDLPEPMESWQNNATLKELSRHRTRRPWRTLEIF